MSVLKAALLGRSLTHSISPEVHCELFEILRTKVPSDFDAIEYSKIECQDERAFRAVIKEGRREHFTGFNITFPYKFIASNLSGQRAETVRHFRSANTIACTRPRRIISTDGDGFRFALQKSFSNIFDRDYSLTILGAGAAARVVMFAVWNLGWWQRTFAARNLREARRAANLFGIRAVTLDEFHRDSRPQLIVQATPVGQRSSESLLADFPWEPKDIAADLVYNPLRTHFLERAAQAGARTLDGLGMLIEQAALSQYFWMTGREAKESVLSMEEFQTLHASCSKLLTPRWDAFDI